MKAMVKEIHLERAEGPAQLCGRPEVCHTFAAATRLLSSWSTTAPKHGGYDKCDVTVVWEDGRSLKTRYDLKHHEVEIADLMAHVRSEIGFWSGTHCPSHMTQERYEAFLGSEMGVRAQPGFADLAAHCVLDDVREPEPSRMPRP